MFGERAKAFENIKLFDSHLHIIDPRFPLVVNNGYLPEVFSCKDYLKRLEPYQLVGGAVVSGSFQGFDQSYLLSALQTLGSGFVGVTQLPYNVSDDEIMRLHNGGVRALRFNVQRGGSESIQHLTSMANRVYELAAWHIELYIDSNQLEQLSKALLELPAVSIDHLGLSKAGLPYLLKLAEKGVKVKATGFGRLDFKAEEALRLLYRANPNALMFGTDLPSTRAPTPFQGGDIDMIFDALGADAAGKVLYQNAVNFYKPENRADLFKL